MRLGGLALAGVLAATATAAPGVAGETAPRIAVSAPPAPEGCRQSLRDAGLKATPWPLRPTRLPSGVVCEAPEGLTVQRGKSGLRFQPPARVNCAFALRLVRFEAVVQEEARRILGSAVRTIVQLGTYNCRRMAAYPDLVSEHSFANALDVAELVLASGKRVSVERDFVPASQHTTRPAALFLRALGRRLFDEHVFSVVLTPSYDAHHKNHFHLDGASYSVDGT